MLNLSCKHDGWVVYKDWLTYIWSNILSESLGTGKFRNRKVFSMNTGKVPDPTNDVEQESRRDLLTVDDFCIRNLQ